MIDYKELLRKYMAHVVDCEGASFVEHASTRGSGQYEVPFTQEEVDELRSICSQMYGDYS